MTIRTACSSALVGLHESCLAIQRGDCDAAIVGGANLIIAPGMTASMTEKGVLSPEGSCKTFSADADGYARGEAITAVFIKPLDAAIRDGNPIRAVIRSTSKHNPPVALDQKRVVDLLQCATTMEKRQVSHIPAVKARKP